MAKKIVLLPKIKGEKMAIPSFFRMNKPRHFKYVPRYYDPEKEEREERIGRIKEELGLSDDEEKGKETDGKQPTRRSSIQRGSFSPKFASKQERFQRNTPTRLVIIILVLILLLYIFWRL
jgi:hypothetical protein